MPTSILTDPSALYRVLAETAPDAIITIDESSTILSVNPAGERIFGYAATEMLGQPLQMLMPQRLRAAHAVGLARYLATGSRNVPWQGLRLPIRTKAGVELPAEVSFGEFVSDGRRLFSGFLRDVSERVASEQALAEAHAQLQDQAAELEATNEELQATAAALEEQVEHAGHAAVALRASEERTARLQRVTAALSGALTPREVASVVVEQGVAALGGQAGVVVTLEAGGDPASAPGCAGGVLRLLRTIGYPAELIERWAEIPLTAPVPIAEAARTGAPIFLESTDAWAARYPGTGPLRLLPSSRSWAAVPLVAHDRVLGVMGLSFATPHAFAPEDRAFAATLAQQCALALDRARLFDAERASRDSAEAARATAEEAARLKTEFLSTMSHEFRTPLNAILGYAQLFEMGVLGPSTAAQHAHLQRLQTSARHLLRLVDDVLDIAKVDADRLKVRRDPLRTDAAAAAALTLVQPQATAKGVRLVELGAGKPGVPYLGDEHRVQQILVNLLSNAVKFTPPGGHVTLACGAADVADPRVPSRAARGAEEGEATPRWKFMKVEDTGHGIAPDLQDQLFTPFVQGDGALTREHGGTGLGLAISRRLARLMGGDITVRSEPGAGATFTLWLPGGEVAAASVDRPVPAIAPTRRTPAGAPDAAGPTGTTLDDVGYAVLHTLGVRLAREAEAVAERYVAALRADVRFPGARALPSVQLRDHATPLVGLLASHLMVIGETRGRAPELLRDGAQVQRVMAELHGAQRHRLGWSEVDIEREAPLLLAEVERAIADARETALTAHIGNGAALGESDVSADPVRGAMEYAAIVVRDQLEQATWTALRAFRSAGAADLP